MARIIQGKLFSAIVRFKIIIKNQQLSVSTVLHLTDSNPFIQVKPFIGILKKLYQIARSDTFSIILLRDHHYSQLPVPLSSEINELYQHRDNVDRCIFLSQFYMLSIIVRINARPYSSHSLFKG